MRLVTNAVKMVKANPAVMKFKLSRRNPFEDAPAHLLIFCCHHKVGTSWFGKIFSAISEEFGLPMIRQDQSRISSHPAIFFHNHSIVDFSSLNNYRGAHIVRDPRDLVISGYHYHLWTKETWANIPIKDIRTDIAERWPLLPVSQIKDMTYKQYLNSLSREDGIMAEINRACPIDLKNLVEWDYTNKNFFEFKYETIMENEETILRKIFQHYGFNHAAVEKSVEIASQFSFKNATGRNIGEVNSRSHLRSGKSQQWKSEFNEAHKMQFKNLLGEGLIKLGYEKDLNW